MYNSAMQETNGSLDFTEIMSSSFRLLRNKQREKKKNRPSKKQKSLLRKIGVPDSIILIIKELIILRNKI